MEPSPITIPFGDLARQSASLRSDIMLAVRRVINSGRYILGAEVEAFEHEFAAYCNAPHCVGVASGQDALYLALCALEIGPGDDVITVANAGSYQVQAIRAAGAQPILVDIDPAQHTLDPAELERALTPQTRAIMPVYLYGRLANMTAISRFAEWHNLAVISDAAQAHGAWRRDWRGQLRRAGAWETCACFSFYPSKNLGALGDGGAVVTFDADLAHRLRQLRNYGWGERYVLEYDGGRNSRLDEIQAAVLRVKLGYLDVWNTARRERAAWYRSLLAGVTPLELPGDEPGHVYHLFVLTCDERDHLHDYLLSRGIQAGIHYPVPVHHQPLFDDIEDPGSLSLLLLPNTERQAQRVLSLPLYPEINRDEVEQVAAAIHEWAAVHSH